MVNQSLIDVCASFISGGQPPDPHCVVPCRAAALKHSAYSAPLRLCVKTYNSTYSICERGKMVAGVGLPERSEPEGPQGAARERIAI